jgi:hypothetical protein
MFSNRGYNQANRVHMKIIEPIAIIAAVVGVWISNALYNELRNMLNRDGLGALVGRPSGGPGPAAAASSMPSFPSQSFPPPSDHQYRPSGRPSGAAPPGFKPFTGQGYRLDGKK